MFLLAQTTTGTTGTLTPAEVYKTDFANIAIQILNIVFSTLFLLMQQVLTGFFSFILPAQ
ncbi:MAG TPA: hypothetical protein VMV94_20620 [Phycisphaerae bacterium]|nr:hypothetical protein [Phycisphaerae bacterium]